MFTNIDNKKSILDSKRLLNKETGAESKLPKN